MSESEKSRGRDDAQACPRRVSSVPRTIDEHASLEMSSCVPFTSLRSSTARAPADDFEVTEVPGAVGAEVEASERRSSSRSAFCSTSTTFVARGRVGRSRGTRAPRRPSTLPRSSVATGSRRPRSRSARADAGLARAAQLARRRFPRTGVDLGRLHVPPSATSPRLSAESASLRAWIAPLLKIAVPYMSPAPRLMSPPGRVVVSMQSR